MSAGCYICQPDNPEADGEGCEACDRDYWASVISASPPVCAGHPCRRGVDCRNPWCPLARAEHDGGVA